MLFNEKRLDFEIDGKKCFFSTGKIARKSQSAVMAGMGDTVVLATINSGPAAGDGDFFPLSVEYLEKMFAAGLISSSRFVKRERFPSDDAILKARIIDRSIRSRFPHDYRDEVLVIVEVLSYDAENDPVLLAINAVSAALLISKTPFNEPVSGVRIGLRDGKFAAIYNNIDKGNDAELEPLNLVVAGDGKNFSNIDANAVELEESKMLEAMRYSLEAMNPWIDAQKKFAEMAIDPDMEKGEYLSYAVSEDLFNAVKAKFYDEISQNLVISQTDKDYKNYATVTLEKMFAEFEGKYSKAQLRDAYEKMAKYEMKKVVLQEGKRIDGRAFNEIREMDAEVGLLPRAHGTGLFTRGFTQILTVATLGTIRRQQTIEDMTGEDNRTFMHFYSEAPFTHGEVGRYKYMPGRREVGHGALAEKAMLPVIPNKDDFPYTIILNSEIMSEMGSSSMGSICGSTLALMDAGVPIKKPVAGIACGIIVDESDMSHFEILTDIREFEDFYGYMDFKVAGTKDGVTAIQMDTKCKGLPIEVFEKAIMQSREGRMQILEVLDKAINSPREKISKFAPQVEVIKIPVGKIGELIGPGGKNVKGINEKTGVEIEIEEDGTVYLFSSEGTDLEQAKSIVSSYAFVPEIGKIYEGKVVKIAEFGAFVEIAPGYSGLVHVSEMSDEFVKDVRKFVKEYDIVKVKIIAIDEAGKIRLSMKSAK